MARRRQRLIRDANGIEANLDDSSDQVHAGKAPLAPLAIVPYSSYGTETQLRVIGRVQEDRRSEPGSDPESAWQYLLSSWKRPGNRAAAGARLRARFSHLTAEISADSEGEFDLLMPLLSLPPSPEPWREVSLDLVDSFSCGSASIRGTARILVPHPSSEYGVVSDIDDLVVRTGATNLLAMARHVVFHDRRTRLPFAGIAAFHRVLAAGRDGSSQNPIFYVSGSPWNLHELLANFFRLHGIPAGPLDLAGAGRSAMSEDLWVHPSRDTHKLRRINRILETYPALRFVLIGDSGGRDPEIFARVARSHQGRLVAVYIRESPSGIRESPSGIRRSPGAIRESPRGLRGVSGGHREDRDRALAALAKEVRRNGDAGADLILVDTTLAAAEHAVRTGLIGAEALTEIRADTRRDEEAPELAAIPVVAAAASSATAPSSAALPALPGAGRSSRR